ncbi:aldo/keto reductase [Kineosporia succinea]|uniref:Aryl-alcohol dehydrogenase-like predicted oxidoreductase n=1 Tax=Kineosporia succinea TaxID=84632 RepID=A0ABT9P0H3_9ACTN|nr:aldo/keto reductase [Kineosporia succinea]MDP9826022.1 aryl-alcohol dehydrogenase-like predicted oxidoreductase [Kineosporia succinea]
MSLIPRTDLDVSPLCLGGNVFGWTADEQQSMAVLDAYTEAGGNFIDTAEGYSHWVPGNQGGESETIIGNWLARRGRRDDVIIATKLKDLSREGIRKGVEGSLRRLQTDYIDLYYAHYDAPDTPQEETAAAFGELVAEGKVRYPAASNFTADRLAGALRAADELGVPRYVGLQPHYNLVERDTVEGPLASVAAQENLALFPYYSLASGFLTGKYRTADDVEGRERGDRAGKYLDERGFRVLDALDRVAAAHEVPVTTISLAWLLSRPDVVAPIASARTVDQLPALLAAGEVELTEAEVAELTTASA